MKTKVSILFIIFTGSVFSQEGNIKSLSLGNKWIYYEEGSGHGVGSWISYIVEEVVGDTIINSNRFAIVSRTFKTNNSNYGVIFSHDITYERADSNKLYKIYYCGSINYQKLLNEILYDYQNPISDTLFTESGFVQNIERGSANFLGIEQDFLTCKPMICLTNYYNVQFIVLRKLGIFHISSSYIDIQYERFLQGAIINDEEFGDTIVPNLTSFDRDKFNIVSGYSLMQNFPNPFNPITIISYSLPNNGFVNITIYNSVGQKIETLVNENQSAGNHSINFGGEGLQSGLYFYRIITDGFTETKKMVLIK